jgi:YVTN family beta-propeller protein
VRTGSSSSRHAYVTNLYGNDVAVIDLEELLVVGRIPVGDKPNGISFSRVPVREQDPVVIQLPQGEDSEADEEHGGDGH